MQYFPPQNKCSYLDFFVHSMVTVLLALLTLLEFKLVYRTKLPLHAHLPMLMHRKSSGMEALKIAQGQTLGKPAEPTLPRSSGRLEPRSSTYSKLKPPKPMSESGLSVFLAAYATAQRFQKESSTARASLSGSPSTGPQSAL